MVLSSLADAIVSLSRISKFLLAEELLHMPRIDPSQDKAVSVDADFEWELVPGMEGVQKMEQKEDDRSKELKMLLEKRRKKKADAEKRKRRPQLSTYGTRWKFWKAKQQAEAFPMTKEIPGPIEDEAVGAVGEKPFGLKDLRLEIQKGAFVAIVGRVGSGKV
jgi:ABC-type multidrug transport system fused ATPase/permease subunit